MTAEERINQPAYNRHDLAILLQLTGHEKSLLFARAAAIKEAAVGNKVYFRGLIEFSNRCAKNCFYCGIRSGNDQVKRYSLTDEEIVQSAIYAQHNRYASIVLQSGELSGPSFVRRLGRLLEKIHRSTDAGLRVTLSCGEQNAETYRYWRNCGADRYLLRIESSSPELYEKLHPKDPNHRYERRLECLQVLQTCGYQVGTGVMIGLPFQTIDHLAGDLLFMKQFGIDMVGMGPYLEHRDTPLYEYRHMLLPAEERFQLTLKMIALLRITMPDINIAATTALQSIDKLGREKAIRLGANVIMPNITPGRYRDQYQLYENKPCTDEQADDCKTCLEARIALAQNEIAYGEWGDSRHYTRGKTGKEQ